MWRRRKGRDLLREHELAALDALLGAVAAEARSLIERQVDGTQHVQRLYDDAEVDLYPNRGQDQRHDPALAFPNRSLELKLATVGLRGPNGTGKVVVHAVKGHIFQLAFRPAPRQLGDPDEIVVTDVMLHADVMLPDDGAAVEAIVASLDAALRSELEERWASGTAAADGLLDREELYSTDLEDGTYMLLGLLPDQSVLVAPIDPSGPGVRRYEPEGELLGVHPTLADALAHHGPRSA
jgi:hypothetical protein